MGRWLSRDPIGEEGGFNLYEYVEGDPLNYIDELGMIRNWWRNRPTAIVMLKNTSNFVAGFGDSLTFGGTAAIRKHAMGLDDTVVDKCSGAYAAGAYTEAAAGRRVEGTLGLLLQANSPAGGIRGQWGSRLDADRRGSLSFA